MDMVPPIQSGMITQDTEESTSTTAITTTTSCSIMTLLESGALKSTKKKADTLL